MDLKGPDQAAVLALNAIGQQDTYLYELIQNILFKYETKQHSKLYKNFINVKPYPDHLQKQDYQLGLLVKR